MVSIARLDWTAINPGPGLNNWAIIDGGHLHGEVIAEGLSERIATLLEGLPALIDAAEFADSVIPEGPAKLKLRLAVAKVLGND